MNARPSNLLFLNLWITTNTNKNLGEQHYAGIIKRDQGLKEKEDKAAELLKTAIVNENDPENNLFDHFNEFLKMDVKITEEEITFVQLGDDQGSTYPDNNLPEKNQSTPNKQSDTSSQGNKENDSVDNKSDDECKENMDSKIEIEYKTIQTIPEQQNKSEPKEVPINDNFLPNESEAIIQEILDNDCNLTIRSSAALQNTHVVNTAKKVIDEKEVPLLSHTERLEVGSIRDNYEKQSEIEESFVLTPRKSQVPKQAKNVIPETRKIKHKPPTNNLPKEKKVI